MNKLVFVCALFFAAHTAEAGGLRGQPGTVKLCTNGTPNLAAVPGKCDGECQRAAEDVCKTEAANPIAASSARNQSTLAGTSWQGAVITGIGNFVGDRAQAEVQAWFERLVREHLCKLATSGAKWFPHTCKLIEDDSGAGLQLASPLMLQAVKDDIPSFLLGLSGWIKAHSKSDTLGSIVTALPALAAIGIKLLDGENPLILLRDAASDPDVIAACRNREHKSAMTGACLVVFAGVTVDFYGPLIKSPNRFGPDDLKKLAVKLLADGEYRCTVLKVIADSDCTKPDAETNLPAPLKPLLAATVITTPETIGLLFKLVTDAAEVSKYLTSVFTGTTPTTEQFREQLAHTLDLLDPVWDDLVKIAWIGDPPKAIAVFRDTLEIANVLAKGEYRAVVLKLLAVATDNKVKLPAFASRLIPMITDIIEAQNAGDVSAALGRAAAPIGGWRLKREKVLLSVTALVGGGVGYEAPFRSGLGMQSLKGGYAAGLLAPIGFEVSFPLGRSKFGLLASVVDVGQVTWARIEATNETSEDAGTKTLPDPSFSQVLSPGLYAVFGLGDSPFVVGAGASIAPELRSYTYDASGSPMERDVTVWRAGVFLGVDVTVFPF